MSCRLVEVPRYVEAVTCQPSQPAISLACRSHLNVQAPPHGRTGGIGILTEKGASQVTTPHPLSRCCASFRPSFGIARTGGRTDRTHNVATAHHLFTCSSLSSTAVPPRGVAERKRGASLERTEIPTGHSRPKPESDRANIKRHTGIIRRPSPSNPTFAAQVAGDESPSELAASSFRLFACNTYHRAGLHTPHLNIVHWPSEILVESCKAAGFEGRISPSSTTRKGILYVSG